ERHDKFRSHGHIKLTDLKICARPDYKIVDYSGRTRGRQEVAHEVSNGSSQEVDLHTTLADDFLEVLIFWDEFWLAAKSLSPLGMEMEALSRREDLTRVKSDIDIEVVLRKTWNGEDLFSGFTVKRQVGPLVRIGYVTARDSRHRNLIRFTDLSIGEVSTGKPPVVLSNVFLCADQRGCSRFQALFLTSVIFWVETIGVVNGKVIKLRHGLRRNLVGEHGGTPSSAAPWGMPRSAETSTMGPKGTAPSAAAMPYAMPPPLGRSVPTNGGSFNESFLMQLSELIGKAVETVVEKKFAEMSTPPSNAPPARTVPLTETEPLRGHRTDQIPPQNREDLSTSDSEMSSQANPGLVKQMQSLQKEVREFRKKMTGTSTVPARHSIYGGAALHKFSDSVMCRVFPITFTKSAQLWFSQLPPRSISNFDEFSSAFLHQFTSCRKYQKMPLELFSLNHKEGEILLAYINRFTMARLEVPSAFEELLVNALAQGLRRGEFFQSLVVKPALKFGELLERAEKYIHLEEALKIKDEGEKKRERYDREDRAALKKPRPKLSMGRPRFDRYTPLETPQGEILQAIERHQC
ncbi:hypothetical protein PHJA_002909100, partial [Phtheirospermum japonicum]